MISFKPKWYWLVLVIAILTILIRLGFWQLNRAAEKEQFLELRQRNELLTELPVFDIAKEKELFLFRPIEFDGTFTPDTYWLVDNKISQGRVGYHVIALAVTPQNQAVLVNLGWIQGFADRSKLPEIVLPENVKQVKGRLYIGDSNQFLTSDHSSFEKNSVIPQIVFSEIAQEIVQYAPDLELKNYVIQLSEEETYGYVRQWQGELMPPEKHFAYAVQWYALAAALMVIFIIVNLKRVE